MKKIQNLSLFLNSCFLFQANNYIVPHSTLLQSKLVLSNVGPLMGGEGRVEGREERGVGWEDRRDEHPKTDREDIKIIGGLEKRDHLMGRCQR